MFIVSLTYEAPLEEIDAHLDAHRAFLDGHFASGVFLTSGPKVPRTGGIILVDSADRDQLDRILADDPFHKKGLARYSVEGFRPTRFADVVPDPKSAVRTKLSSCAGF